MERGGKEEGGGNGGRAIMSCKHSLYKCTVSAGHNGVSYKILPPVILATTCTVTDKETKSGLGHLTKFP